MSGEREREIAQAHVSFRRQLCGVGSFYPPFMWVTEIKFSLPGLCSKCLLPSVPF